MDYLLCKRPIKNKQTQKNILDHVHDTQTGVVNDEHTKIKQNTVHSMKWIK